MVIRELASDTLKNYSEHLKRVTLVSHCFCFIHLGQQKPLSGGQGRGDLFPDGCAQEPKGL